MKHLLHSMTSHLDPWSGWTPGQAGGAVGLPAFAFCQAVTFTVDLLGNKLLIMLMLGCFTVTVFIPKKGTTLF